MGKTGKETADLYVSYIFSRCDVSRLPTPRAEDLPVTNASRARAEV
jgi:hypothetical protein